MSTLESILVQARDGHATMKELLSALMVADVVLPSGSEVLSDGSGLAPLLFTKEAVQMVACFTDRSRIGEYAKMTPYYLAMKGAQFLRGIPAGCGVVVNPGQEYGFDISPDGLKRILSEFPTPPEGDK